MVLSLISKNSKYISVNNWKIAEIGYNADEVKASKAGFDKLPACCQSKK